MAESLSPTFSSAFPSASQVDPLSSETLSNRAQGKRPASELPSPVGSFLENMPKWSAKKARLADDPGVPSGQVGRQTMQEQRYVAPSSSRHANANLNESMTPFQARIANTQRAGGFVNPADIRNANKEALKQAIDESLSPSCAATKHSSSFLQRALGRLRTSEPQRDVGSLLENPSKWSEENARLADEFGVPAQKEVRHAVRVQRDVTSEHIRQADAEALRAGIEASLNPVHGHWDHIENVDLDETITLLQARIVKAQKAGVPVSTEAIGNANDKALKKAIRESLLPSSAVTDHSSASASRSTRNDE